MPDPDPFSLTVTVEDVYGKPLAELEKELASWPVPYRPVRFALGRDISLAPKQEVLLPGNRWVRTTTDLIEYTAYLIVEPMPKPKRKEIVFVEDENGPVFNQFIYLHGRYRREEREVEA